MFIVFLEFSRNRDRASEFMTAHNEWLKRGFDEGSFVLAGSLEKGRGGALLATSRDREALDALLARDPFVERGIVRPEVIELRPQRAAPELSAWMSERP